MSLFVCVCVCVGGGVRAVLLSRDGRQQEVRCIFNQKAPPAAEASAGKGELRFSTQIQFIIVSKSLYKCCPLQLGFAAGC